MTGELNPSTGYMVSHQGAELVVPRKPTPLTTELYIAANAKQHLQYAPNFLGMWYNEKDGNWYYDVSEHIADKDLALQLAKERKQLAIFDCSTGESIYLDKQ